MDQKEVFMKSEGNDWFRRNQKSLEIKDFANDIVCQEIQKSELNKDARILEIGCAAGHRLKYLKNLGYSVKGIEPSFDAVSQAIENGIDVVQGTADDIKIVDQSIDILIFGFCLYLVDPSDYFKIASESYRVLSNNGIIIVNDFSPKTHFKNKYIHLDGINSYKFDFTQILLSHPHLVLKSKTTELHSRLKSDIDNQDEWVQISLVSKHKNLF